MNPSVTIRWHGVPFVHKDAAALEVISGALNGPTGRIQRNVVLGAQVAASGNSHQETRRYSGFFEISAEAKEDHTPEEVERALHAEIEKLKKEPLAADELQSVKNRYLATSYRTLNSNFQIMLRYLVGEGFGDLRGFERLERDVQAVTAADVTAALNRYFTKENRAVAIWTRAQGAEREDPALASLPPQAKAMVKQALTQIEQAEDPAKLQEMLARMAQMEAQVPPEMKPAIDYIKGKVEERLSALSDAGGGAPR
jgi:predicted Zn-dependent peptidase